ADVAGIFAGPALDTGVVAEQCRRCMPGVAAFQAEPGPEERVAAAGVDEIARLEPQRAIVAARMYQRRASIQLDPIDPDAVACVHALRARVVEQQLVELRTLDVEGKAGAVTERALEREAVVAAVVDREVGAELEHADPAD